LRHNAINRASNTAAATFDNKDDGNLFKKQKKYKILLCFYQHFKKINKHTIVSNEQV